MDAPRSFTDFMRETLGKPWVVSNARGASLQRLLVGRYEGYAILSRVQYRKFCSAHASETADRIGTDPTAALRAFLAAGQKGEARDGTPFHLSPDEGLWLALERTLAALEASPTAAELLRECVGAMDSAEHQIGQMSGMFNDEDGTIAEAVEALGDASARAGAFLRGEPVPPHVWEDEEAADADA